MTSSARTSIPRVPPTTVVTCCQLTVVTGALEDDVALSVEAVRGAVAAGADVVVLPELATSGCDFASPEEAASLALPAEDVGAAWAAVAGGAVVVGGFCERGDDGRTYNSAVVVDASGVRAVYRKAHLWDREKLFLTPGGAPPPVVETAHGRIGVLICYDLGFPEWPRTLALGGADLIAVPTNWPLLPRPAGERPIEVVVTMAAARANHVAIACADRTGTDRGQVYTGGTAIVGSDGWVLAAAEPAGAPGAGGGGGSVSATVDLTATRGKALTPLVDLLGDRRPDLYGALTAPVVPSAG